MSILDRIHSPADLKPMTRDELRAVSDELRVRLIEVCSRTGGHIGAGLGVVELTVALHAVFDTPRDRIVWDVGHQGYPHKFLTGRGERFETLRQENGLSGFLKRTESEYDTFGAGHAGTAISAGYGMAVARDLNGDQFKVVSILGDGALTCGLAYEGLNNAGASERDFIVILNDNEMSIAPNVGAMSKYLTSIQRNPLYNRVRSAIGSVMDAAPGPLAGVGTLVRKWEESVKAFLTPGILFEELGFRYFGPIDGHDIDMLMDTFAAVKDMSGPRLIHCITQKGKGFPAGEHVEKWHALPPGHDPATGKQRKVSSANTAYTAAFGQGLVELASENQKLVAITGAMPSGTGTGGICQGIPGEVFRRRNRGGPRGHFRGWSCHGRHQAGVRDLLDVPPTRVRQRHSRCRHPAPAGDLRDGSRRRGGRGWSDAHGPVRHCLHARRAGDGRHGAEEREGDDRAPPEWARTD